MNVSGGSNGDDDDDDGGREINYKNSLNVVMCLFI